jgi:iron complex transport system ATP-binding protein
VKLEVRSIHVAYNSSLVLEDLTLSAGPGEILSVIGPNGAGKSTLLRCVDRILKPKAGTVFIDGKNAADFDPVRLARIVGYVPQSETRGFPVTVFDAVLIGRRPHMGWRVGARDLQVVTEVITVLGLEDLAMRDVTTLSGGERQKVVLARALAQEPEVLLLDEPTSNLDLRHQLEVLGIVRDRVRATGMTAVMAIHDLNLAARYSDRIAILKDGRVFAVGGPEVLTPANIEAAYGVKADVVRRAGGLVVIPEEPA